MAFRTRNVNPPLAVNGGLTNPDPWNFSGLFSQTAATGTVTITGSETNGDLLTITFTSQQLPGGTYAVTLTTSGSESLSAIATALKGVINADPRLSMLGVTATSVGAVITITWIAGPLGNFATMAFSNSGSTETATIVQFSGGAGYVTPQQDYTISNNGAVVKLFNGNEIEVDYAMLKTMIAAGLSIL